MTDLRPACDGCDRPVRCRRGRGLGDDGEDFCRRCMRMLEALDNG
jgi:hypothetical protein